jgi:predicted negative regulator of RcsB-dependent stress response
MNNLTEQKPDLIETIKLIINRKKLFILILLFIIISLFFGIYAFKYYQDNENKKISEKYIKANIYLAAKNLDKSKTTYKEIIDSNNKFYSILALNSIIENNLENDSEEILKLFNKLENIKQYKTKKNLLKLKKSLYLINISKKNEGKILLNEIIESESVWKDIAKEILKD